MLFSFLNTVYDAVIEGNVSVDVRCVHLCQAFICQSLEVQRQSKILRTL